MRCCIAGVWAFQKAATASGVFSQHRRDQNVKWVHEMIDAHLHERFVRHTGVRQVIGSVEKAVAEGSLPAVAAVHRLLEAFEEKTP